MPSRADLESREAAMLAPYAMRSRDSRGRRHPEAEHPLRMAFQRDRDRIIHSTAFRRLEYKTQVFVNHEGDYYRTRLTHTVEAAQVTRTLARALGLNEDLAEAVALAHDLGHTPFGHAGERTLDRLMAPHGGFDHNSQSLRIVDVLEERYPAFHGLNLSWEVREGIVKHSTRYDRPQVREFDADLAPCLEAQIVDFADEIAYNAHDIDDGLKSGMLEPDDLAGVALWAEAMSEVERQAARAALHIRHYQGVRRVIDRLVEDLCGSLLRRLKELGVETLADVRRVKPRLVEFTPEMTERNRELKAFLYDRL
jgi:dGTPase